MYTHPVEHCVDKYNGSKVKIEVVLRPAPEAYVAVVDVVALVFSTWSLLHLCADLRGRTLELKVQPTFHYFTRHADMLFSSTSASIVSFWRWFLVDALLVGLFAWVTVFISVRRSKRTFTEDDVMIETKERRWILVKDNTDSACGLTVKYWSNLHYILI